MIIADMDCISKRNGRLGPEKGEENPSFLSLCLSSSLSRDIYRSNATLQGHLQAQCHSVTGSSPLYYRSIATPSQVQCSTLAVRAVGKEWGANREGSAVPRSAVFCRAMLHLPRFFPGSTHLLPRFFPPQSGMIETEPDNVQSTIGGNA